MGLPSDLTNEGVSECEEQADTNTDHWNRIKQARNDEHFDLKHWSHFWLTSSTFQKATTQ